MTRKELTYTDLHIALSDIFSQMGYGDAAPDAATVGETEDVVSSVKALVKPMFVYTVVRGLPDTFHLGNIIARQLEGSEAFALFIATAGLEYEQYQSRLKEQGDMVRMFIADALGSVIAERCADEMEKSVQQSIDKLGWKHTNRFSPGYCGWDVSEQQLLFPLLGRETCGVRLTESSLMVPIKSVSGIIGLGKGVSHKDYTCGLCNYAQCYKRKSKIR